MSRETNLLRAQLLIEAADLLNEDSALTAVGIVGAISIGGLIAFNGIINAISKANNRKNHKKFIDEMIETIKSNNGIEGIILNHGTDDYVLQDLLHAALNENLIKTIAAPKGTEESLKNIFKKIDSSRNRIQQIITSLPKIDDSYFKLNNMPYNSNKISTEEFNKLCKEIKSKSFFKNAMNEIKIIHKDVDDYIQNVYGKLSKEKNYEPIKSEPLFVGIDYSNKYDDIYNDYLVPDSPRVSNDENRLYEKLFLDEYSCADGIHWKLDTRVGFINYYKVYNILKLFKFEVSYD